jgi:hypothetical protein
MLLQQVEIGSCQQQQQQQQQQLSSTSISDVCAQANLVWHISTHLVLKDAAALACSSRHTAAALRGCLHGCSSLQLCPRIIIAASGKRYSCRQQASSLAPVVYKHMSPSFLC